MTDAHRGSPVSLGRAAVVANCYAIGRSYGRGEMLNQSSSYVARNRETGARIRPLERNLVFSRLTSILIVSAGLLGAAYPAIACAAAATSEECCPALPSPCDTAPSQSGSSVDPILCCIGAPAPPQSASVDSDRKPDPFVPIVSTPTSHGLVASRPSKCAASTSSFCPNSTLTYLRTARLRL